jgi:hypothetical protein
MQHSVEITIRADIKFEDLQELNEILNAAKFDITSPMGFITNPEIIGIDVPGLSEDEKGISKG